MDHQSEGTHHASSHGRDQSSTRTYNAHHTDRGARRRSRSHWKVSLMGIPLEVRTMIFKHLIRKIIVDVGFHINRVKGAQYSVDDIVITRARTVGDWTNAMGIILTCKSFHTEAVPLMHQATEVRYNADIRAGFRPLPKFAQMCSKMFVAWQYRPASIDLEPFTNLKELTIGRFEYRVDDAENTKVDPEHMDAEGYRQFLVDSASILTPYLLDMVSNVPPGCKTVTALQCRKKVRAKKPSRDSPSTYIAKQIAGTRPKCPRTDPKDYLADDGPSTTDEGQYQDSLGHSVRMETDGGLEDSQHDVITQGELGAHFDSDMLYHSNLDASQDDTLAPHVPIIDSNIAIGVANMPDHPIPTARPEWGYVEAVGFPFIDRAGPRWLTVSQTLKVDLNDATLSFGEPVFYDSCLVDKFSAPETKLRYINCARNGCDWSPGQELWILANECAFLRIQIQHPVLHVWSCYSVARITQMLMEPSTYVDVGDRHKLYDDRMRALFRMRDHLCHC